MSQAESRCTCRARYKADAAMTLGWTDPAYGAGARWLQRERNGPDRSPIDAVPARLRRAGNPPRAHRSLPRPQLPLARTALTSQSAFPLCAVAHEHSSCHGSFPIPARARRPSPDGPWRAPRLHGCNRRRRSLSPARLRRGFGGHSSRPLTLQKTAPPAVSRSRSAPSGAAVAPPHLLQ